MPVSNQPFKMGLLSPFYRLGNRLKKWKLLAQDHWVDTWDGKDLSPDMFDPESLCIENLLGHPVPLAPVLSCAHAFILDILLFTIHSFRLYISLSF